MLRPLCGLTLLALSGCQSAPQMMQRPDASVAPPGAEFGQALAASIEAVSASHDQPNRLSRSQAQHRKLIKSQLPALLAEAAPATGSGDGNGGDVELDPGALAGVTPIVHPRKTPLGLERAGIGLPVVAALPAPSDPNAPRAGYHLPATLVARPNRTSRHQALATTATRQIEQPRGCCEAVLVDPDQVNVVETPAGPLPIAMDLFAPIQATKATGIRPMAAVANLVRPGHFTGEPRIVFLEPFNPGKTPVVLVHGLLSTPGIWKPLVTQLLAVPQIRDCCQIWFFYYPTGQPVPLSALQLRDALDDVVTRTGLKRKMILIGHSMGGILSRAQVSQMSPERAEQILPGVTELPQTHRVRRALVFEPRADVSRVIFLFVPHQGSQLAANGFGALAVRLIRLPDTLLNEAEHVLDQLAGHESRRLPTSIHGLSPRSAFLNALSATQPTVPVHSIIGNRGRGDGRSGSDGVVPVRSARLPGAESELVVPTGHGGFDHPDAVSEIKRIILTDVAQQQTAEQCTKPH